MTSTSPVTFTLADENGGSSGVGTIGVPGQTPSATSVTVNPVLVGTRRYAFAEYLVPMNFIRNAGDTQLEYRPVKITGTIGTTTGFSTLKLVRPPILLVHGLDSEATAWELNIQKDDRFIVQAAQYRATNHSSFHTNRTVVLNSVRSLLSMTRAKGIAATQAIVVGHSMGGLLARIHGANQYGWYRRRGNLGQGDFYKYISLYTPHEGSGVACAAERLHASPLGQAAFNWRGFCVNCGAIANLRPDSPEISTLPAMPSVPSHVVVGMGGAPLLGLANQTLSTLGIRYRVAALAANLVRYLQLAANDVFASFDHDLVVSDISARGGLLHPQLSLLTFIHYGWASTHTGVTNSSYMNDYTLLGLLDEQLPSPRFASGLPANTSYPVPQACLPGYQFPSLQLEPPTSRRKIKIHSSAGLNVKPGSTIEVTIYSSGGFQARAAEIDLEGASGAVSSGQSIKLFIPEEADGPYTLRASAVDSQHRVVVADPITLNVISLATLQSIEAVTPWIEVGEVNDQYQLSILGNYTGAIQRDITPAAKGSIYLSSDPAVVTVSADGLLTAVTPGTAEVLVTHGGFFSLVTAVVRE